MLTNVYMAVLVSTFLLNILVLIRNFWVYRVRTQWISEAGSSRDFTQYDNTVTYGGMLIRWWSWNRDISSWKKNG